MEKVEKLEKFIKDNSLKFDGKDSSLNSDCVILSGYALYLEEDDVDVLTKAIRKVYPRKRGFTEELERVFDYASFNNYGEWWTTKEASLIYSF